METDVLKSRFSNVQLELLQLFTEDVPVEELQLIKDMLSAYRFERATAAADEVAKQKGWTAADFERLLNTHERTPYPTKEKD